MDRLRADGVVLDICPTSNLKLGVVESIATIKDKKVLEAIEKHMLNTNSSTEILTCTKIFIAYGPVAESYTWKALKRFDSFSLGYLFDALSLIGTERSLFHLNPMTPSSVRNSEKLRETIDMIKKSKREPEKW